MKNKKLVKGMIFSMIAVLMSALFIAIFSFDFKVTAMDKFSATNIKVKVMDTYVRNFETYSQKSLKVASYRTLESMTKNRTSFYSSESEFNNTFKNCVICGYNDCNNRIATNLCPSNMTDFCMEKFLDRITELGKSNLNIVTNYTINSVSITQSKTNAFELEVSINISFYVSDGSADSLPSWNKTKILNDTIFIYELSDPYIKFNSNNSYNRTIKQQTICTVRGINDPTCWNTSAVKQFYDNKEYMQYNNGTAFLSRFWNSTSSSKYGIITFVEVNKVQKLNTSYMDVEYWSGDISCDTTELVKIDSIATDFILSSATANKFNIVGVKVCE